MSDTSTGGQTSGIPGWVWGMLAGVLIFAAGYVVGGFGDEAADGGGAFGDAAEVVVEAPSSEPAPVTEAPSTAEPETEAPLSTAVEVDEAPSVPQFSDLPPIAVTELPGEALDTLSLIASGGPYPFDRDGLTFQNREGLLPDYPRGHYQEFTVITPGLNHRGAKRIVAGADGELYYTSDHYESFREIVTED